MVLYRRQPVAGATWFFTIALADRDSRHLVVHIDALREAYRWACVRRPFMTEAICVLPEHLHAIWRLPDGDADIANRWRIIKARFTRALLNRGVAVPGRDRTGRVLWQRRYWEHRVRDDVDLQRHVDYIHGNPVKHGLVSRVVDWPHSSFHAFLRKGWVGEDWGCPPTPDGAFGERD